MMYFLSMVGLTCSLGGALLLLGGFIKMGMKSGVDFESPFECGFSMKEEGHFPFSLRLFLLALIFVIFDVELIILFPIMLFSGCSPSFMVLMVFFLSLVTGGLLNEWNQGCLDWVN